MELLTIGEFARASRLSAKALRLYDELGLLRPAVVDPGNGYRRYAPDQLERARLVAWLRRIGMPLAEIRTVVELPGAQAPESVMRYWQRIEADTRAKRRLATDLVEYLSGRDTAMSTALAVKYAVRTDRGLVRKANQDSAYAGEQFARGRRRVRGAGATASQAAVDALQQVSVGDLLNAMDDAAQLAGNAVQGMEGSGTTLTALLWSGSRWGSCTSGRLAGLPAPRRAAFPDYARRHARPGHGGRRKADRRRGRLASGSGVAQQGTDR